MYSSAERNQCTWLLFGTGSMKSSKSSRLSTSVLIYPSIVTSFGAPGASLGLPSIFSFLPQAREDVATIRLDSDSTAKQKPGQYTVQNFMAKIMDQCQKVYLNHESILPEAYIKDSVYRGLVWEMVELQVSSFIFITFQITLKAITGSYITIAQKETYESFIRWSSLI